MRAIIYTRISRDTEGKGLGVTRQLTACRELAEREGLDVVAELSDNDLSAYSGKRRPAWNEARDMIKNRKADVLIGWAADRFTRHPRELEDLVDLLADTRTIVRTVTGGEVDLSTSDGRMVARIVGSMARHESERKSERAKAKAEQLAMAGRVGGGGSRPFGFNEDRMTIRTDEADALRWAATEVIGGASLYMLVRTMRVPPVEGGTWTPTVLRRTLMRPRVAGLREHHGEIVADAEWEGILDRATWERVRAILTDPRRLTRRPGATRYLLTGLAFDKLGRSLFARPNARGARCYVSLPDERGPGVRCEAEPVERLVLDLVRSLMAEMLPRATASEPGDASAVEMLEAELDELLQLRQHDQISLREYLLLSKGVRDRLDAARSSLGVVERPVDAEAMLARWDLSSGHERALTIEERRRTVAAYISKVTVLPAIRGRKSFDPSRVLPTLRLEHQVVTFEA